MKVKALLVGALLWCVSLSVAFAQCGGQAASGYACGNGAASQGFASFYPLSTLFDRGIGSTQGTILNRTNTGWVATIAPTLGVAGTSQGTLAFAGATSGTATITAQAVAGSPTITLPNASGTVADGASSPLVLNATTGNLTCPTCVTSSGGGSITGVSPVNVSAAGAVSLQGATGSIAVGSGGTGSSFTATPTLGVAGSTVGSIAFANLTSGSVTIQPATGALGTAVATLPAGTYNLVGDNLTQTLTNKTLTAPVIATISNTGTLTLPTSTDTLVGRATTDTLTNKTINGANNTLTVLAGSQLSGQTPIANGGTNCAAASGTCLDNITGFSSTGFISRTGAGGYSFSGSTGSGNVVLANSPTLIAPALGTPTGVTLTNATGLPLSTGINGFGTGVAAALGNNLSAPGGVSSTIASGTIALGTSAISSGACAAAVTATATGVATTDVVDIGFNSDPTGVAGYTAPNMLTIIPYPTSNTVNVKVCNDTGSSITPGAVTLNWSVRR